MRPAKAPRTAATIVAVLSFFCGEAVTGRGIAGTGLVVIVGVDAAEEVLSEDVDPSSDLQIVDQSQFLRMGGNTYENMIPSKSNPAAGFALTMPKMWVP